MEKSSSPCVRGQSLGRRVAAKTSLISERQGEAAEGMPKEKLMLSPNPITTIAAQEREGLAARPEQQLPAFAEKEYIDSGRACKILGVSPSTLTRLAQMGFIQWMSYSSSWKRVNYHSIVAYCDHLRRLHHIPDRRPPLGRGMRYRDADLLPFPLADTVSMQKTIRALGCESTKFVVARIEEGRFEAYQVVPMGSWRISYTSLQHFIQRSIRSREA
jgi:hypothetical protein